MGMNLEVYDRKDPTKRIGVVPLKLKPRFLEEVSGVGGGSFDVRSSDKRITALQERNIVKVRVNGKIVSGFIITSVRPKMIDSGDFSTEITTITGKGLKQWTEDATVFPHGGLKASSGDERSFNFASPKDPSASLNTWHSAKAWVKPREVAKVHAKNSPWPGPGDWPDYPTAHWLWAPRPTIGGPIFSSNVDLGTCYFRRDFTVPAAGKFSFFVAADDIYEVYVDGQMVANATPGANNYSKTQRIDFDLDKGAHVIGVKVHNTGGVGGMIGAITQVGDAAGRKTSKLLAITNSTNWKVIPFPTNNPGWTPGEIMNQLVTEAKARGVWWAKYVKPTFTGVKDSNGQAWERELDYSFNVGESYLSVINKFAELSCDVWIDPADYTLNMAAMRGQDLADTSKGSKIIQLRKGRDLLGADQTVEANIKNALIVDTSTGKMYQKDNASIAKYGVIEDTLSLSTDDKVSKQIASKVLEESSKFTTGATYKVYPSKGVVPFEDFKVGDWVLAPGDIGPKTRRRVSSISISENADTGAVEYDVEFDTVFQTRQQHLDKWMKSVLSGSMGGTVLSSKFKLPRVLTNRSGGSVFLDPPVVNIQTQDVVTKGYFNPNGLAVASAAMQWGVTNAEGESLAVEDFKYDIYGVPDTEAPESMVLLASTSGGSATVRELPTATEYTFRVVAKTSSGIESTSEDFTVTLPVPEDIPLPVPSKPVISTNVAAVNVTWDGTYVGQEMTEVPPQVTHIRAVASEVPGGPYEDKGPIIPKEGGTAVYAGLTQGINWYVALITVDSAGNESVPSEESLIVVEGIDGNVDIILGTLNKELLDAGIRSELGDFESATQNRSVLVKNHSFESEGSWVPLDAPEDTLATNIYPLGRYEAEEEAQEGKWVVRADSREPLNYLEVPAEPVSLATGRAPITLSEGGTYALSVWAKIYTEEFTGQGTATVEVLEEDSAAPTGYKSTGLTVAVTSDSHPLTGEWVLVESSSVKLPAPVSGKYFIQYTTQVTPSTANVGFMTVDLDNVTLYDRTPVMSVNGNIFSQNPPAGEGAGVGSLWYQYQVVGGVPGDIIAMWRWDGTDWKPMELRNEVIANLDAGKIDTGFLNAGRILAGSIGTDKLAANAVTAGKIAANSVTAGKLVVSGGQNEVWDPTYSAYADEPAVWDSPSAGAGSGWVTDVVRPGVSVSQKLTEKPSGSATSSLYSAMRQVNFTTKANLEHLIPVSTRVGDRITAYAHFMVDRVPPAGMTSLSTQIYFYNAAGSNISDQTAGRINQADVVPNEWMRVGGIQITVPDGAMYAIVRPTIYYTNSTTALNGAIYYLGGEEMYWANAGELIVDGSITSNKISATAIDGKTITGNIIYGSEIYGAKIEGGSLRLSDISPTPVLYSENPLNTLNGLVIGNYPGDSVPGITDFPNQLVPKPGGSGLCVQVGNRDYTSTQIESSGYANLQPNYTPTGSGGMYKVLMDVYLHKTAGEGDKTRTAFIVYGRGLQVYGRADPTLEVGQWHEVEIEAERRAGEAQGASVLSYSSYAFGAEAPARAIMLISNLRVYEQPNVGGNLEIHRDAQGKAKLTATYGGLAPTGSVTAFAGQAAPEGWLMCDGSEYTRVAYPNLYDVIGATYGSTSPTVRFKVPDLRGRVGVGLSTDAEFNALGKEFGTKTHTLTTAQMPSHNHSASTNSTGAHTHSGTAASAGAHTHGVGGSGTRYVTTNRTTTLSQRTAPTDLSGTAAVPAYGTQQDMYADASTVPSAGAHTHSITANSAGAHSHTVTINSTGSGSAHNNIQPSIALNYIIKT